MADALMFYDDDVGFAGYVETTVDPGTMMLLLVTMFCLGSQLLLPCMVIVGRRYEQRRLANEQRALTFYQGDDEEEDEARDQDGALSPRTKAQMQSLAANGSASVATATDKGQHIHFRDTVKVMNGDTHEDEASTRLRHRLPSDHLHDDAASAVPSSYVHGRMPGTRSAMVGQTNARVPTNLAQDIFSKMVMPPYPDDKDQSLISGQAYAKKPTARGDAGTIRSGAHSTTTKSHMSTAKSMMSTASFRTAQSTAHSTANSIAHSTASTTFLDAGVGRRRRRHHTHGAFDHHRRIQKGVEEQSKADGINTAPAPANTNDVEMAGVQRNRPPTSTMSAMDHHNDTGSHIYPTSGASEVGSRVSLSRKGRSFGASNSHDGSKQSRFSRKRDSSPQPSALSRIVDDISPNDAADANDPGLYILPKDDDEESRAVDLCGERAWWRPLMLAKAFDDLIDLAEYDRETQRILKLAIPFTFSAIIESVFEAIGVALVSKYIGTDAVIAYALADIIIGITSEICGGIIESEATLCSHAIGAGNNFLAGQYVQLAAIIYLVCQIPFVIIWYNYVGAVMLWLGFDPQIAQLGQEYARVAIWGDLLEGVAEAYDDLLEVSDHEKWSTFLGFVEGLVDLLVTVVAVVKYEVSLVDLAIINIMVGLFFFIFNVAFTTWKGWTRPYTRGMIGSFAFRNKPAVRTLVKTAVPLSIGSVLAYGEWELLTIFAAALGDAEGATWILLGSIWDIFESSTEGIGDAAEVRCAYHLGTGNPYMAKISSYKSLLLGIIMSLFVTAIFFILGDSLPAWFTSDPTLQRMIAELIPLVGVGNCTMTFGMVCWALVGAQGRYRLATFVAFACSWCVTLPLSALFVYGLNIDLQGLTAAVVIGYSTTGTLLSYVLLRSDWERLSKIVQELNALTGECYSDSDDDSSSSSSSSSDDDSDDDSDTETSKNKSKVGIS